MPGGNQRQGRAHFWSKGKQFFLVPRASWSKKSRLRMGSFDESETTKGVSMEEVIDSRS